jgi:hypothetical protein
MPEPHHDHVPGLVDQIGMSLKDLAELDEVPFNRTLDLLLPESSDVGARLWQNNAENLPC